MQRIEDAAYAYAMDRFGRRQLRYLINKGHCDVTVAEVDDQVIGFGVMLFRRGSTVARVFSLAVRPEFQSRGTTSALWGYTRPRLLERGYDRVHCEVRVANAHAADYFKDLGFAVIEDLPDHFGGGLDGVRMELDLRGC